MEIILEVSQAPLLHCIHQANGRKKSSPVCDFARDRHVHQDLPAIAMRTCRASSPVRLVKEYREPELQRNARREKSHFHRDIHDDFSQHWVQNTRPKTGKEAKAKNVERTMASRSR